MKKLFGNSHCSKAGTSLVLWLWQRPREQVPLKLFSMQPRAGSAPTTAGDVHTLRFLVYCILMHQKFFINTLVFNFLGIYEHVLFCVSVYGTGKVQRLGMRWGSSLRVYLWGQRLITGLTSPRCRVYCLPVIWWEILRQKLLTLLTVQNRMLSHILAGLQHPALACSVQWGGTVTGS